MAKYVDVIQAHFCASTKFLQRRTLTLLNWGWRCVFVASCVHIILGWQDNVHLTLTSRRVHDSMIWQGSSGNSVPAMKRMSLIPQDACHISFSLHHRRLHSETKRAMLALRTMELAGVALLVIDPVKRFWWDAVEWDSLPQTCVSDHTPLLSI